MKMNSQILLLEDIFENRRHKNMKRPKIKDQVLNNLNNCIATPSFLK
jgi:hypothetical protein